MYMPHCIVEWGESENEWTYDSTSGLHLAYIWSTFGEITSEMYIYIHLCTFENPPFQEIDVYIQDTFGVHLEYICVHLVNKYISIHLSENW